jgi:hypothetical protein
LRAKSFGLALGLKQTAAVIAAVAESANVSTTARLLQHYQDRISIVNSKSKFQRLGIMA